MIAVFESDMNYRRERDLHHHLTVLFERIAPLKVGQSDAAVAYEWPTTGVYQWTGAYPTSGNLDMFFFENDGDAKFACPSGGTAVEINCNYRDSDKNKRDLIKLLDPMNRYGEAIYAVVSTEGEMRRSVEIGLDDAVTYLGPQLGRRPLPPAKMLLIEELGGWRFLYEGLVEQDNAGIRVEWSELRRRSLHRSEIHADPLRPLTKAEAKQLLQDGMRQEQIGLGTVAARCMFEAVKQPDGRQVCHFGKTPLWDHVVETKEDQVSYIVFLDRLNRLVRYGRSHQGR